MGIGHARVHDFASGFPVGRNRVEQREQIRRADNIDGRAIQIGGKGDAGQGRVSAVGPAQNPDALRIGDAFVHQIFHAPGEIVLHLRAPLAIAGVEEFLPVARRAAKIRHEHGIAAIGEELRQRIVAPLVAHPRSAVRNKQRRQTLRRQPLRQGQISGDFQAVGRFVTHRLHGRERFARQFLADFVLEREGPTVAVEQIRLARLDIAVRADQPLPLIRGAGNDRNLTAWKLGLQPSIIRFKRLVAEIPALAIVGIKRRHQFIGVFGEPRRSKVNVPQRIGFHGFQLARRGIQKRERRKIQRALVGLNVNTLRVPVKLHRIASLKDIAGVDGRETAGIHAQNFLIARVLHPLSQAQIAFQIEDPGRNSVGVPANERALAGGDTQLVEIVPALVAIVEADIDHVRIALGRAEQHHPHPFQVGEIARWRSITVLGRSGAGINRVDVEVLVAGVVFHVDDVLAVPSPQESCNRPGSLGGHQTRGAEWIGGLLDPNIARFLPRFKKRDVFAVGRELAPDISGSPNKSSRSMIGGRVTGGRTGIPPPKLSDFVVSSQRHARFLYGRAHLGAGQSVQFPPATLLEARASRL